MQDIDKLLNLNFDEKDQPWIHSGYKLRQTIGIVGMLLPWLLIISLYLYSNSDDIVVLPSISHYYFTRSGTIFTATLVVLAVFLLIFKSRDRLEFWISTLAGLFALFVAIAPTDNLVDICCDDNAQYAVTHFMNDPVENNLRVIFHYGSAGLFFLCLAFMSFFLFTKPEEGKRITKEKKQRNFIYKVCAIIIVVSILLIPIFSLYVKNDFYEEYNMTFWLETAAVESFGYSWLIRGETFFKDGDRPVTAE